MFVKRYDEVEKEEVNEEGAKNVEIQWLIDEKVAPNFAMRRFTIKENGYTPLHKHDWEHEVFILEGTGKANSREDSMILQPGDVFFVPSMEGHQFVNTGDDVLKFLCLIPYKDQ